MPAHEVGNSPTRGRPAALQRVCRHTMWETALLCGPPGAAAGMPAHDVGNSPTLRAAGRCSENAGARCGKQPYIEGGRALQRVCRHTMWETALLCGPPGATAGAPASGVGNSPTLRAAGRCSGRTGVRCGKQPYFAGRRALQRVCRRTMWETALLCGPPGAAAGMPAHDVGNSPTLRAAGRYSGRSGVRCGKQPYFTGRRALQRAHRRQVWETALLCGLPGDAINAAALGMGNSPTF